MIRVLLAEDEQLIRAALSVLLSMEPDIEIVATASEIESVLPSAREFRPDVAVIDVNLAGRDGLAAAAELQEQRVCAALLLTSLSAPETVRRALDLRIGGYLLKDAAPTDLSAAIRKVAGGQRAFDPALVLAAWESRSNPLTEREGEVLALAAAGQGVHQIARAIRLSPGTVRNYLSAIVVKLGARNRLDAVRIAREAGWILTARADPPEHRQT